MNVKKTEVMRISRKSPPEQIRIHEKQQDCVEYFNYFGSMVINCASYTFEIKSGFVVAKEELNKKNAVSTASGLDLILRTKLVLYYTWSVALYDAEILRCAIPVVCLNYKVR